MTRGGKGGEGREGMEDERRGKIKGQEIRGYGRKIGKKREEETIHERDGERDEMRREKKIWEEKRSGGDRKRMRG